MKEVTSMNVIIKGVEVGADAALAVQYGADGIWVSNHGGRATETERGTIECLPDIVAAVNGRVPIIVDSGFRRGTDIYKALLWSLRGRYWQTLLLGSGCVWSGRCRAGVGPAES